mmetsp:Transcript_81611/g.244803  ORF Transcript_81611/g.244803 Transcript_81611/m.244803 type:complete len:95 (-) Transcript_81611:137-421(-)|eukprot:6356455-Prymnesium_polylepis.1
MSRSVLRFCSESLRRGTSHWRSLAHDAQSLVPLNAIAYCVRHGAMGRGVDEVDGGVVHGQFTRVRTSASCARTSGSGHVAGCQPIHRARVGRAM